MRFKRKKAKETTLSLINEKYGIENEDLAEALGISLRSAALYLSRNYKKLKLERINASSYKYKKKWFYYKQDIFDKESLIGLYRRFIEIGEKWKSIEIKKRIDRGVNPHLLKGKLLKPGHLKPKSQLSNPPPRVLGMIPNKGSRDIFEPKVFRYTKDIELNKLLRKDKEKWLLTIHERAGRPLDTVDIKERYYESKGKKGIDDDWFDTMDTKRKVIKKGKLIYNKGYTSLPKEN